MSLSLPEKKSGTVQLRNERRGAKIQEKSEGAVAEEGGESLHLSCPEKALAPLLSRKTTMKGKKKSGGRGSSCSLDKWLAKHWDETIGGESEPRPSQGRKEKALYPLRSRTAKGAGKGAKKYISVKQSGP